MKNVTVAQTAVCTKFLGKKSRQTAAVKAVIRQIRACRNCQSWVRERQLKEEQKSSDVQQSEEDQEQSEEPKCLFFSTFLLNVLANRSFMLTRVE